MFDKKTPKNYTDLLGKTNRIVEETTIEGIINSQADFRLDGVLKGDFTIGNIALNERDGLGIWDTDSISIIAKTADAEILLMEVPMAM